MNRLAFALALSLLLPASSWADEPSKADKKEASEPEAKSSVTKHEITIGGQKVA